MSRFTDIFSNRHTILPVIHVQSEEQAFRNVSIAQEAKADGVFLIGHTMPFLKLLKIHDSLREQFPSFWMGMNCLDLPPKDTFEAVGEKVDGIWTDNAMVDENATEQPRADEVLKVQSKIGWKGLYFGGTAFKYQRRVEELEAAAKLASRYMDVVTTSGPGTGHAAGLDKIKRMKSALGDIPLAIASGITPENVKTYMPYADCFLVATGISKSFEELDPLLVEKLVEIVRSYDRW